MAQQVIAPPEELEVEREFGDGLMPPQPPVIDKVESGWNAEVSRPRVRVFLERFESKGSPLVERFTLEAGQREFGPLQAVPVAEGYEVFRQTSIVSMSGGLLAPAPQGSRLIRVGQTTESRVLVLQDDGNQAVVRVIRQRVLAPGNVQLMLSAPLPFGLPIGGQVFIPTLVSMQPFVSGDLESGIFELDRAAAGIPPSEVVILIMLYREMVEYGKWSVYLMRELAGLQRILAPEEIPATAIGFRKAGQAGALFLDMTLPAGTLANEWHGQHIAVGVSMHRSIDEGNLSESPITWIPATLMVAPPRLEVLGITSTAVRFKVVHPTAAPSGGRGGAMVYRYPDGEVMGTAGYPLNRSLVTGDLFADAETEPNRLLPAPPENGPRYLRSGDRVVYVGTEMVESHFPLTTLRALERPSVVGEPYTVFVEAGQQEEITDGVNQGDAMPPTPTAAIVVLQPNGGEVWPEGSRQFVRWTTSNLSGLVAVYLSRDGGSSYSLMFDNLPHDAGGVEVLSVPAPATTSAKVMVRSKIEPAVLDMSDNVFEIRAADGEWIYNETPAGEINGVNAVFTLSERPNPPNSLLLFKNGQLQQSGGHDYTLDGAVITFVPERTPQVGDAILATFSY